MKQYSLCQSFTIVQFKCLNCIFIWVGKNEKHFRGSMRATIRPLRLGQCDGLGSYCGPHTASSVFLILIFTDICKALSLRPNLYH